MREQRTAMFSKTGSLGATDAIDGDKLRAFPFRQRPPTRIYQFDRSRGVSGFPDKPQDALKTFDRATLRSLD